MYSVCSLIQNTLDPSATPVVAGRRTGPDVDVNVGRGGWLEFKSIQQVQSEERLRLNPNHSKPPRFPAPPPCPSPTPSHPADSSHLTSICCPFKFTDLDAACFCQQIQNVRPSVMYYSADRNTDSAGYKPD